MLIHGAFEKAKRYIEAQSELKEEQFGKKEQGVCVTISRQAGAGGNTVSNILLNSLEPLRKKNTPSWTLFDKNLIEKVIEDNRLPKALLEIMDESNFTAVTSIVNELMTGQPDPWALMHKTFETILQIAQMGSVVVIGRGSNFITANYQNVFHVRLIAPFEQRVTHVEHHYKISHKEALEAVKKDDAARKYFVRKFFHKDINDPVNYHIMINTSQTGFEGAAKIISCAVLEQFQSKFLKI
ncbi:MAG: cytidylate kinase-like family protein [Ignavibacteriaceae bacterium]|nr:cytidylate kinase-like family protein [Ignavibacteriaceae bacterium]